MARIYRLQLSPELVEAIRNDETVATEIIKFDSTDEKKLFLKDPEVFCRNLGIYTPSMKYQGLGVPEDALQAVKNDLQLLTEVIHDSDCQMRWNF